LAFLISFSPRTIARSRKDRRWVWDLQIKKAIGLKASQNKKSENKFGWCVYCTYLYAVDMKRRNYFIDDEMVNKLEKHKSKYGFASVSAFIRFIIASFFNSKNL
jgi:hypothetical protein